MIGKLRIKLVCVSMMGLFMVLVVVMSFLNAANYRGIVQDADSILNILRQNSGRFPIPEGAFDWRTDGPRYKSPELPFEIRYFSVLLTDEGEIDSMDTEQITGVDGEEVEKLAIRAYRTGKMHGFMGDYRFVRYDDGGGVRIIFLYYGRVLAGCRNYLLNSVFISAVSMAAFFLLITIMSRRIMRPFAENHEKQKLFITDAGHEIKTPVTIIDAAVEMLEMEIGENEWLMGIRRQAQRLNTLTNDLIRLSRMEECEGLEMIEFPLGELVSEQVEAFRPMAMAQNKVLHASICGHISWKGHEESIRQLISILLDNALRYSPEGSGIGLVMEARGRSLYIKVQNESVQPLERLHIDRIFDRFYRGDPSRSSECHGYGIGLSVAKAIVAAHRGRITASTPDGKIMTVTAVFPN